jgi:DNA-binding transcriptional LysR family regulator
MEFRVLRYFLTVAREESITKAAELLFITQPTLSRQLKQLEEELGTQLLIRGKRKVTLSEAGMLLRNRAEEIVSLVEKTQREFQEHDSKINGLIYIGIPESDAGQRVIQLLKSFQEKYPEATYDIYTGTADLVKERMEKGLLDIGLLMEPSNIEKYNYINLEEKERWGILLPIDSPLAKKDCISPEDLKEVPLLVSRRYKKAKKLSKWFGTYNDQLRVVATFNLTNNAVNMVKIGMGYATVVGGSFLGESENKICFRPLSPTLYSRSVLAWKKHQVFSPTVNKFMEHLSTFLEYDNNEVIESR